MAFVVNEPTCMSTGEPASTCRCAAHAPAANRRSQEDEDDIKQMVPPTMNDILFGDREREAPRPKPAYVVNGDPGEELMIPPTINWEEEANARRAEQESKRPKKSQLVVNVPPCDEDGPLPVPPRIDWATGEIVY